MATSTACGCADTAHQAETVDVVPMEPTADTTADTTADIASNVIVLKISGAEEGESTGTPLLEELFVKGQQIACALENGDLASSDKRCVEAVCALQKCSAGVRGCGMFSKNEELDDVKTKSLRYLLIDFYLGQLTMQLPVVDGLEGRYKGLKRASAHLWVFMERCAQLKMVKELSLKELRRAGEGGPRRMGRDVKIALYKRRQELQKRVRSLEGVRRVARERGEEEDEDLERRWSLLVLQEAVAAAKETISTAQQELSLLAPHVQRGRQEQRDALRMRSAGSSNASSRSSATAARPPPPPKSGNGLKLTHVSRAPVKRGSMAARGFAASVGAFGGNTRGGNGVGVVQAYGSSRTRSSHLSALGEGVSGGSGLQVRRETLRNGVFQPDHLLPTMSLEEFARHETEDALRRQAKAKDAPKGPRRIEQLERDGDEDDARLVRHASYYDRDWDDWKDDNPKGAGVTRRI